MANISRNSYDESKNYDKVILQQGKPLTDYDFNEAQDIQRGKIRRIITELTGGGAIGDGWKIVGTGATNNFTVKAGALYKNGYRVALAADSTATALGLTLTTPTVNRTDEVYLDIYEVEIDSVADPNIVHDKLAAIGMEPTRRIKIKADLKIAEGGSVPADTSTHFYYHLATINRLANNATITADMVIDRRSQAGIIPHKTAVPIDHPDNSITDVKIGNRTINQALANPGNTGLITSLLSWLAGRIKAITGKANWYDAPDTTLAAAKAHFDAAAPHSGHVLTSDVVTVATANKILKLNNNAKLPASITGDADTVDGKHAADFISFSTVQVVDSGGTSKGAAVADSVADTVIIKEGVGISVSVDSATDTLIISATGGTAPTAHATTHITGGSDVIPNAVAGGSAGLMSGADKQKLDSIEPGAEVNQNAFSQVKVGSTTIDADSKTDVLELAAGANIALTPDAANDKITIAVTGTVAQATNADTVDGQHASAFAPASHVGATGSAHGVATTSAAGFMSAEDKAKLDGIAAGAEVNQKAFSQIKVGTSIIDADAKTDMLEIVAGANISITADTTNDRITIAVTGTVPQATNADTVDNLHASDFAPASHVGATGTAHGIATTSTAGFMSSSDKAKLDGIQTGAEVNQNAFSQVKVGTSIIEADAKTDRLEIAAGANIAITADTTNDKLTIAGTGTWPNADTVDGKHASDFLLLAGGNPTGTVNFNANSGARLVLPVGTDKWAT